ncbi:hypothetical protein HYV30_01525 [Candidatus Kaiserbacteria bacterium]|nr:hypothetical protein [Candidatus Kaiserbacteria bacterium]
MKSKMSATRPIVVSAIFGAAALLAATSLAYAQYDPGTPSVNMPPGTFGPNQNVSPSNQSPISPLGVPAAPQANLSQNIPGVPQGNFPPMIVSIDRTGSVLLRGIAMPMATSSATTATTSAFTVNSWGGMWTVRMSAGTQVLPAGLGNIIGPSGLPAGITTGDFIGLIGTVAPGEPLTIDATLVRDWTLTRGVR